MMKLNQDKLKIIILSSLLAIFIIIPFVYKMYINNKCKDLYFATEYQMARGFDNNRLLRVQTIDLVFFDTDYAVVETYGLNKDSPHEKITYEAHFKRKDNKVWKLEKATPVN